MANHLRILSVRLRGKKVNITIIQVYAPTSTALEEEQDNFFNKLQSTIDRTPKGDVIMVIGDFHPKVRHHKGGDGDTIGGHSLGIQNEAGERLKEFCDGNNLGIMNTWFEQPKRIRLYTWTSPDRKHRNQIDYILINKRWKSTIRDVRTKPGADCETDHELLVATLKTKLKKLKKPGDRMNVYDCKGITPEYRVEIKNRFEILERDEMEKDEDPNELWEKTKRTILETAEKHITKKKKGKTTPWLSKEAISIADERKDAKRVGDKDKVRSLNRAFQKKAREDKEKHLNDMCKVMEEEGKN